MINKENDKKKQTINILLVPRIVRGCEEGKKTSRSRLIKAFANFSLFFFFSMESPGAFQQLSNFPGSSFSGNFRSQLFRVEFFTFHSLFGLFISLGKILSQDFPDIFPDSSITSIYLVIQPFPPLNLTSRPLIH